MLKTAKDYPQIAVVVDVNGVVQQRVNEVDMEINGASPSAYKTTYDRPVAISNSTEGGDGDINIYVVMPDTVEISPEAAARAYAADSGDGSDEDDVGDEKDVSDTRVADAPEASTDADAADAPEGIDSKGAESSKEPSTPKSFVYGALGLERPEKTEGKSSDGYDFGRWMAAGVTIGTIISVLV